MHFLMKCDRKRCSKRNMKQIWCTSCLWIVCNNNNNNINNSINNNIVFRVVNERHQLLFCIASSLLANNKNNNINNINSSNNNNKRQQIRTKVALLLECDVRPNSTNIIILSEPLLTFSAVFLKLNCFAIPLLK